MNGTQRNRSRARLATFLFIAATALIPSALMAQRAELEKIIKRKVLANGLEVIVVENHGVPLATVEVNVKNGSFTQSPDYAGLAHMYEHMFFRSNARYPQPEAFIARAGELGAVFNGTTREEVVNYYITLSADSVDAGIRFLAAALTAPLFRQGELERERQVVIGEYDRNESSPFFRLNQETDKLLYPGNFSRKNVIGDRQVILTTTPEKMRTIQRKYYIPNNSALIVSGDVDPEKIFASAERELGSWQRGPDPFITDPIPKIPALAGNDAVIVEAGVGAVTVFLQWQGPSVGEDPAATYTADVFSDVLNDPGSNFQQRLVDSGLWQSVGVNYYTLNNVGPITISGQTSPENLRKALDALDAEIARFTSSAYFDLQELAAVKAHRAVSSAFDRERASSFAHTLGFWWSVADLEYYMGYVDNMAKQTISDLNGYAAKYIAGKPRITGILIDPSSRRALALTTDELKSRGAN